MRLTDRIRLVGSGALGFGLTEASDCHVYLVDGGDELALVDAGAGLGAEAIVANVRDAGFDPTGVRHLILTHAHADHAGGAARLRALLGNPTVYAAAERRDAIEGGDEVATSLDVARRAGAYPLTYRLEPCPVDVSLHDGDEVAVGAVSLQVLAAPGHADGQIAVLLDDGGRRALFSGDSVFVGGKIMLEPIHDCRLDRTIETLRRFRALKVDCLLPGHGPVVLRDGQAHIEHANAVLDRLLVPEQLLPATLAGDAR